MSRTILERVLLFALPFAIYGGYLLLLRMRPQANRPPTPWTWLFVSGLALVVASFIVWRLFDAEPTTGVYVAPHVVNGKVVPGYVEQAPEKKAK